MKSIIKFAFPIFLSAIIIFTSCQKKFLCPDCEINKPPIAIAGLDQITVLPKDSTFLDGSNSSDADGKIISYKWTKVAGPVSSNISKSDSSKTMVRSLVTGVYKFELTVTDNGGLSAKDTIQIMVNNPAVNQPPIACAGADQTITLPADTIALNGSCSTDPDNNISNYVWVKISGPSSFNIANVNAVQTQVTNLVQGTYQFELKVTDAGGLYAKDTVQVIVNPQPPPPVACDNSNRPQVPSQLISVGMISKPREGMAVAAAGTKVVFAGGVWTANCPRMLGQSTSGHLRHRHKSLVHGTTEYRSLGNSSRYCRQ